MHWSEPVVIVQIVSGVLVCASIFIGFLIHRKSLAANHSLEMRIAAMNAVKDILSRELSDKLRKFYSNEFETITPIAREKIETFQKGAECNHREKCRNGLTCTKKKRCKKQLTAIRRYLNALEILATGVHERVYDEDVIKRAYKSTFINATIVFQHYISLCQAKTTHHSSYKELGALAQKWKQEDDNHESPKRAQYSIQKTWKSCMKA